MRNEYATLPLCRPEAIGTLACIVAMWDDLMDAGGPHKSEGSAKWHDHQRELMSMWPKDILALLYCGLLEIQMPQCLLRPTEQGSAVLGMSNHRRISVVHV